MPELPEVETIVSDLRNTLIGCTIVKATVNYPGTLATPQSFHERIEGQKILKIERRAKYLVFTLSGGETLIVHLRMTGRFLLEPHRDRYNKHEHVVLTLDNGMDLRYHDTRKFGRWYLVKDISTILGNLGPEPLDPDFTLPYFEKMLQGKTSRLKPLLLDQDFIAGLGNIYVDEALWEAKLHPERHADSLTKKQIAALHKAIIYVLERGIKSQGTSLGKGKTNYFRVEGSQGKHQSVLNVFRRTGEACPRCGTKIERIVIAQRSTHICPHCQKN